MEEMKLKSCPFCGGEADISDERFINGHFVFCTQCHIQTKLYTTGDTTEQAINDWNTRKPVENVLERLEGASYWTPSTYDIDGYCNDDSEEVIDLDKAIEIIKEEVG